MKHKIHNCPLGLAIPAAMVLSASHSLAALVFSTDFSTIPDNLNITGGEVAFTQRPFDFAGSGNSAEGSADIDVATLGLSGQWLFTPTAGQYVASLTLAGLTPGGTLDIGFFFNAGGGLDGGFGGQTDGLEVRVDGVTVFDDLFGGRSPDRPGYGDTPEGQAAAIIRKQGVDGAPASNLNGYRTGAWGHDALYDMSLEPSLQGVTNTASTATIEFIVTRSEADADEYFGLANLTVNAIPEPGSFLLVGLSAVGLTFRRRR